VIPPAVLSLSIVVYLNCPPACLYFIHPDDDDDEGADRWRLESLSLGKKRTEKTTFLSFLRRFTGFLFYNRLDTFFNAFCSLFQNCSGSFSAFWLLWSCKLIVILKVLKNVS